MSILVALGGNLEARLAAYLLAGIDGEVVIAGSIAELERGLASHPWSVVVLDTTLPDGDALTVLRRMAARGYEGAAIVLGAAADALLAARILDAGADDYLVRPYDPAEFVARVRAMLRRSRRRMARAEGAAMRAGGLELDAGALAATLPDGRRVSLTPNEMRVLRCLMTRAGRVVGHQELAHSLFGPRAVATSANTIGVYVRRVRRKIETDPAHPRSILTVRGGYQFRA